jgi:hypothetical protein
VNCDDNAPAKRPATRLYAGTMTVELHWPYVPPDGWTAADLDHISPDGPNGGLDALKRIELIDGEVRP